jgi:hypothetical protein
MSVAWHSVPDEVMEALEAGVQAWEDAASFLTGLSSALMATRADQTREYADSCRARAEALRQLVQRIREERHKQPPPA